MPSNRQEIQHEFKILVVNATYFVQSALRACLLNNLQSEANGLKIANKRVLPFKMVDAVRCNALHVAKIAEQPNDAYTGDSHPPSTPTDIHIMAFHLTQ